GSLTLSPDPDYVLTVRDAQNNIAWAIDYTGQVQAGSLVATNLTAINPVNLPSAIIAQLSTRDITFDQTSGSDWISDYIYSLTFVDGGGRIGSAILPDGRIRSNFAIAQLQVVAVASLSHAPQVPPGAVIVTSSPVGGMIRLTSSPGSVWYV